MEGDDGPVGEGGIGNSEENEVANISHFRSHFFLNFSCPSFDRKYRSR